MFMYVYICVCVRVPDYITTSLALSLTLSQVPHYLSEIDETIGYFIIYSSIAHFSMSDGVQEVAGWTISEQVRRNESG